MSVDKFWDILWAIGPLHSLGVLVGWTKISETDTIRGKGALKAKLICKQLAVGQEGL